MISGSNELLQQELEYTLLKLDCHSWWISKMQSHTLEERYTINFCFKLGKKMPQKRMECFRLLFDHLAWIEHRFWSGIRDSRKAASLWGMMRGVGGVRKTIYRNWLAKGLGLGLLCWGFKGVQEEIPSEEDSTLQIGSVAFLPGQCSSQQLHPCHRLFGQDVHQDSSHRPDSPDIAPCDFWSFPKLRACRYETIDERGCDEGLCHAHTRGLPWGLPEVVGTVQEVHCSRRRILRRGLEFHVCYCQYINKSAHTKKVWKLI